MNIRRDLCTWSPAEKSGLVSALLALKAGAHPAAKSRIPEATIAVLAAGGTPNRYDDYVWLSARAVPAVRRSPAFFPFYRELLRQIEHDLQRVSGDKSLTLPYWDWTTARSSTHAGFPFSGSFMGGFGSPGTGAIDPNAWVVTSGPFAREAAFRINLASAATPGTRLKRRRTAAPFSLPTRETGATFGAATGLTASAYDRPPYEHTPHVGSTREQANASFRKYVEYLLHDAVTAWVGGGCDLDLDGSLDVGGHMTFPTVAANDPAFFLHLCNLDRLWATWQQNHPASAGYAPREGASRGHSSGDVLPMLSQPSWFSSPLRCCPAELVDSHRLGVAYAAPVAAPSASFGCATPAQGVSAPFAP